MTAPGVCPKLIVIQLLGTCTGRPGNIAVLETVEASDTVGRGHLVAGRIAQRAALPPQGCPARPDSAVHRPRPRPRRPVNRPILEMVVPSRTIGRHSLVRGRIPKRA